MKFMESAAQSTCEINQVNNWRQIQNFYLKVFNFRNIITVILNEDWTYKDKWNNFRH